MASKRPQFATFYALPDLPRIFRFAGKTRRAFALAMQKVEGSSPFIRSSKAPGIGGFCRFWGLNRQVQVALQAHLGGPKGSVRRHGSRPPPRPGRIGHAGEVVTRQRPGATSHLGGALGLAAGSPMVSV